MSGVQLDLVEIISSHVRNQKNDSQKDQEFFGLKKIIIQRGEIYS